LSDVPASFLESPIPEIQKVISSRCQHRDSNGELHCLARGIFFDCTDDGQATEGLKKNKKCREHKDPGQRRPKRLSKKDQREKQRVLSDKRVIQRVLSEEKSLRNANRRNANRLKRNANRRNANRLKRIAKPQNKGLEKALLNAEKSAKKEKDKREKQRVRSDKQALLNVEKSAKKEKDKREKQRVRSDKQALLNAEKSPKGKYIRRKGKPEPRYVDFPLMPQISP
jgi:hypothetical protein